MVLRGTGAGAARAGRFRPTSFRLVVLAALALLLPPLLALAVPPTFRTGVDVIRLNVSVTDGRNHYVMGLSSRDFAIFEDGVRQDMSLFTYEDVPVSLSLLVDCSASMDRKLPAAQEAGLRFVRTLRASDLAQVVQFNDRFTLLEDFTSDQQALARAIQRTQSNGPTILYTALYVALKELSRETSRGEVRRRAIVLLSDGEDTASAVSDQQVLELARRSEIAIYSISLRPDRPQLRREMAYSEAAHFLTRLAQETGGLVYFPNALTELEAVYGRIAEELRAQYTIGYVSGNARQDGKWRRIVVRTPTRDDLQVRHKIGYYAPRSEVSGAGQPSSIETAALGRR
jgi:Ca-activated chloride channel homolog